MDLALTSEQCDIRDSARVFAEREITPYAREWDRREEIDDGIVAELADVGFLGATIPDKYGGTPVDHVSYRLILEELGRADSSELGQADAEGGSMLTIDTQHCWCVDHSRKGGRSQCDSDEVLEYIEMGSPVAESRGRVVEVPGDEDDAVNEGQAILRIEP